MRKITEDFIGTCQACFGEFKVNETTQKIVFHGYKRPGDGYTVGQCVGTDHAPFEYETGLTVRIIGQHEDRALLAVSRLAKLRAGKITTLTRHWREYNSTTRKHDELSEQIAPGHEHWDQTHRIAVAQAESSESYHSRMAAYLQAMVDKWTRGSIVGIDSPATGLPKTLREAYDPVKADAMEERAKIVAARDAKPGKLKVLFYTPSERMDKCSNDAEWRARYDRMEAATVARIAAAKQWVKANIVGKTIVKDEYDSSLPRDIRGDRSAHHDVTAIHLPWEYRDQIETMFSSAVAFENEKKRISFTVAGPVKSH